MSPESQVAARLADIEAALVDLRPSSFGWHKAGELAEGQPAALRYRNRLLHALLLLYHLEADLNRLARSRKMGESVVTDFVRRSQCVRVCWRVANTHKHGIGGRSGNATLPNAVILVVEDLHKALSPEAARATIAGMLVSDADEGSFASHALLQCAVREWTDFLRTAFQLEHADWRERCFPSSTGPQILLGPGAQNVVPLGSVVTFEIPELIRNAMVEDMKKRREDS